MNRVELIKAWMEGTPAAELDEAALREEFKLAVFTLREAREVAHYMSELYERMVDDGEELHYTDERLRVAKFAELSAKNEFQIKLAHFANWLLMRGGR